MDRTNSSWKEGSEVKPILDNRGPTPARKFNSPPKLFMLLESYEVFLGLNGNGHV